MTACVSGPDYHLPAMPSLPRHGQRGRRLERGIVQPRRATGSVVGTVWRPQLDGYVREALAVTPTYALPMPTSGAPALPCWVSRARCRTGRRGCVGHAHPCRWLRRRRPRRSRTRWAFTSLSTGSCRRYPPRHRSRERGRRRPSLRRGTRSRGRRCGRHRAYLQVCTEITRSLQPGRCWRCSAPPGGNPTPGCRRARNGLRCQPCRCRRQPQRGGDTAPSGGTPGRTVRTGRIDGQAPGGLSQEAEACPGWSWSRRCRSVMVGNCSSGAPTYAQPNAAWPPRLQ